MPRPRFLKLDAEKKARLLETAAQEFSSHGYEGASLNHILATAGMSKGAAYYYFDDKADLFGAVVDHYLEHLAEEARFDVATLTAESFWGKIFEFVTQAQAHFVESPWILGLVKALWKLPRETMLDQSSLAALFARWSVWLDALLARGVELGTIRGDLPLELLKAMVMAVDEASDRWLAENWDRIGDAEGQRVMGAVLQSVRRLLAP